MGVHYNVKLLTAEIKMFLGTVIVLFDVTEMPQFQ